MPSRTGGMFRGSWSPVFKVAGRLPARPRCSGLVISILHSSSAPLSFLTSSWMKTWGFVQRKSLTGPSSVIVFDWSNIANEWCASAELDVSKTAIAREVWFSTLHPRSTESRGPSSWSYSHCTSVHCRSVRICDLKRTWWAPPTNFGTSRADSCIASTAPECHAEAMSRRDPTDSISHQIVFVRGQRAMLDSALAELYGVTTRRLNEQVRRNRSRFPDDFLLELTAREFHNLKSHFATSSWGGGRKLALAFSQH